MGCYVGNVHNLRVGRTGSGGIKDEKEEAKGKESSVRKQNSNVNRKGDDLELAGVSRVVMRQVHPLFQVLPAFPS